jgi:hypothetical protein
MSKGVGVTMEIGVGRLLLLSLVGVGVSVGTEGALVGVSVGVRKAIGVSSGSDKRAKRGSKKEALRYTIAPIARKRIAVVRARYPLLKATSFSKVKRAAALSLLARSALLRQMRTPKAHIPYNQREYLAISSTNIVISFLTP